MTQANKIHIVVADNIEADRQAMADTLKMHGFKVTQALDGGTAIKVVEEQDADIAVFAHHMSPRTGFDFARHVSLNNRDIGMVLISDDMTTDLLREATKYEIQKVMRKPVDPDRLLKTIERILRARGKSIGTAPESKQHYYTPDQLMSRAIALAHQNARSRMGGPFAAIVADEKGRILGEGVNSVTSRCDPTAHAEVLAIRQATGALNKTRLEGCSLYCSSEPTMLGQALTISTGISKVYYGLSHSEVGAIRLNEDGILGEIKKPLAQRSVPYEQLMHDEALQMLSSWKQQKRKLAD